MQFNSKTLYFLDNKISIFSQVILELRNLQRNVIIYRIFYFVKYVLKNLVIFPNWINMYEFIQVKSHLCAICVENHSPNRPHLNVIYERIPVRNPISVQSVINDFLTHPYLKDIFVHIQAKDYLNVCFVIKVFQEKNTSICIWKHILLFSYQKFQICTLFIYVNLFEWLWKRL